MLGDQIPNLKRHIWHRRRKVLTRSGKLFPVREPKACLRNAKMRRTYNKYIMRVRAGEWPTLPW